MMMVDVVEAPGEHFVFVSGLLITEFVAVPNCLVGICVMQSVTS